MEESKAANFEYFISMTLRNKIPWNMLLVFLDDLTPTLVKSKQAIEILVKHLQCLNAKLHENKNIDGAIEIIESDNSDLEIIESAQNSGEQSKHETNGKMQENRNVQDYLDQSNQSSDVIGMQEKVHQNIETEVINNEFAENFQKSSASTEMSDIEDDSLKDTIEATNDDQDNNVEQSDRNDKDLKIVYIKEILGEEDVLLEKVGNQLYYEFIGDPKEATGDYNIPKEVVQMDATKTQDELENDDQGLKQIECNDKDSEAIGDDEVLINAEDKIGDQFYDLIGEPEETQANPEISKDNELSESNKSNLVPKGKRNAIKYKNGDLPYNCNKCTKSFTKRAYLVTHEIVHTGEKPFLCTACSITFITKSNLNRHVLMHTRQQPLYNCLTCGKSFSQKSYLKNHERRNHTSEKHERYNMKDKPYKCSKCTKSFSWKISLERHETIHTGDQPFQCPTCSKKFIYQNNLDNHVMIHKGSFPFHCTVCGIGSPSQSQLNIHERIHTGERPHKCKTCSKLFRTKSELTRHERIHTNEKPFQCNTCKKCFYEQYWLKKHEIIHTNEKPFQCNACKKCFNLRESLKRHEKSIHLNEKPYRCNTCKKCFNQKFHLKMHKKIHT